MSSQEKKIVLVTGGTRGIGRAIVETLIEKGYFVLATGTKVKSFDDEMPEEGSAHFYELDLGSSDSIKHCVDRMTNDFPLQSFHGLVNSAAICKTSSISDIVTFMETWKRVIDVNLTGTAEFTHLLVSQILLRNGASIVNVASQLGRVGREGYSAYCASKFGLIGLTEVWSRELARHRLRVNAVCPGWIETDMTDQDLGRIAKEKGNDPDLHRAVLESGLDQRRFNTPQEVANIVAFLLSDEASGITGRCIEMAGPSA